MDHPAPHPALLQRLRHECAAERPHAVLGIAAEVDACLPGGGLTLGALHELAPGAGTEAQLAAGCAWFAARLLARLLARLPGGRPCLWVARQCDLYAPGLLACGLDPGRLVLAQAPGDAAVLAAMEAGLRGGAFAGVVGEVGRLPRLAAQRLQFACLKRGTTGLLLRRWPQGRPAASGEAASGEATAAVTRWRIAPVPSAGPFAAPRWRLELLHARGGVPGEWTVEAGESDAADPVRVVAELADPAAAAQRRRHA